MTYQIIALSNRAKDIATKVFGRLTAIAPVGKTKAGAYKWLFICQCGTEHVIPVTYVTSGHTQSCGCIHREMIDRVHKTHGLTKTTEYKSWADMVQRCCNKNNTSYKSYGKRGITICDEWRNSFEQFLSDMGEKPTNDHTIDRIDNNGNYCKDNCRWATRKEQQRNTSRTIMITYKGETLCAKDMAIKHGVVYETLVHRAKKGVTGERLFSKGRIY